MRKLIIAILLVSFLFTTSRARADQAAGDALLFDRVFRKWTDSFNRKDLVGSCSLFSRVLVADYRGFPRKNFRSICDGFKKIFKEANRRYQYRYKIHEVYRSGDLAAVRITWYLTITESGKPTKTTEDQGLDILKRNADGTWQIVNYVGYEQ